MSDEQQLVVHTAKENKNIMSMFDEVKGLSENSPLKKMKSKSQGRLSVVGNKFVLKRGKTEQTLKGADGKPVKELDVVIHLTSPVLQRQLAEKYDSDLSFRGMGCWSNDSRTPADDVWAQKSQDCDTCPHDYNGDHENKCTKSRLAAVTLWSPDQVPSEPLIIAFNYSSNSPAKKGQDVENLLFSMKTYLEFLADKDVETHRIKTRLVIDDWSDNKPANNSKVLFKPIDVIKEGDPNLVAHNQWVEDDPKRLPKMIQISQYKPEEEGTVGDSAGAPVEEDEVVEEAPKKVAKKKASKKKAAKKAPEPEELDLDDLEDFEEEMEEELQDEGDDFDPSDLGDLDDLEDLLDED